jgi:endonuclease YncB( thermonuclease family)
MKATIPLLGVAAAVLVAGCSRPHDSIFAEVAGRPDIPPPVIHVLKADTIAVDGRRLRLAGVVAPQPAPEAHCAAEALAARAARLRLEAMAGGVRTVMVAPAGSGGEGQDPAPARVYFEGLDVAQALLDEGLAVAPRERSFDWCGPLESAMPDAQHIAQLSIIGR